MYEIARSHLKGSAIYIFFSKKELIVSVCPELFQDCSTIKSTGNTCKQLTRKRAPAA